MGNVDNYDDRPEFKKKASNKICLLIRQGSPNESIHIPAHITEIGPSAFSGCQALKEVILPDGVITIGNDAFSDSGLETINIPDSVTVIGERAFQNTPFDLTDVNYTANGAPIIGKKVFSTEGTD